MLWGSDQMLELVGGLHHRRRKRQTQDAAYRYTHADNNDHCANVLQLGQETVLLHCLHCLSENSVSQQCQHSRCCQTNTNADHIDYYDNLLTHTSYLLGVQLFCAAS